MVSGVVLISGGGEITSLVLINYLLNIYKAEKVGYNWQTSFPKKFSKTV